MQRVDADEIRAGVAPFRKHGEIGQIAETPVPFAAYAVEIGDQPMPVPGQAFPGATQRSG